MSHDKTFTHQEAESLLPWIQEITEKAVQDLKTQTSKDEVRKIINHWAETVMRLGALPKQPFTVDFDSGTDYFCWNYPEPKIAYRHGYQAGFAGRIPIKEK